MAKMEERGPLGKCKSRVLSASTPELLTNPSCRVPLVLSLKGPAVNRHNQAHVYITRKSSVDGALNTAWSLEP